MSAGLVNGLLSVLLPTSPLAPLPSHLPDTLTRLLSALSNAFVPSLGWTLLHFVWQGALIGCATAVLLVALRNASPERRYAVACLALLLCVAWPAVDFVTMLLDDRDVAAARMLPLWTPS